MNVNSESIDYRRVAFILIGIALGMITLVFGDKLTTGNIEALRILVSIFTILAGIMIAVIIAVGAPENLFKGTWRIAKLHQWQKEIIIYRYILLFYVYLVVISLAFISALLAKVTTHSELISYVERITISVGVSALFWSFGLPAAIFRAQKEKMDQEVDRRMKEYHE